LKGVVERTKAGLERARRAGKKIGRPRRLQFTCELRDDGVKTAKPDVRIVARLGGCDDAASR
jgi:DNA invertase Pin-like site-specific DNA recombinase